MSDATTPDTPDEQQTARDTSYSPGSDSEVREAQTDPEPLPDVDTSTVKARPGTGGPDDAGDIDIEDAPIHLPGREPAD